MDAFERFLELDERLLSLQLSPHGDRPPLDQAVLGKPIVFDHPLDACEPIACVGVTDWHHPVSAGRDHGRPSSEGLSTAYISLPYFLSRVARS